LLLPDGKIFGNTAAMALTAQTPNPAGWARWPQHHPNNDYVMMDAGMLPYDSRPVTTTSLQRPIMAPQYFTTTSYSPAPITSMAAPPYQQPPTMAYGGYGSYNSSPAPMGSSNFKTQFPERPSLRVVSAEPEAARAGIVYPRDNRSHEGSRSPSIKSDAQTSSTSTTKSVSSSSSVVARTITSNVAINPANQIDFNTHIDALMKQIQSKDDTTTIVKTAEAELIAQAESIKVEEVCSQADHGL
jgi:hypothetical protein